MRKLRFKILLLPFALGSCQSTSQTLDPENFALPAQSRYSCGTGNEIGVTNNGSSVTLTKPDGTSVELPAVEPGSRSRFGAGIEAIVFDGRSALYMETGKPPLDCKR